MVPTKSFGRFAYKVLDDGAIEQGGFAGLKVVSMSFRSCLNNKSHIKDKPKIHKFEIAVTSTAIKICYNLDDVATSLTRRNRISANFLPSHFQYLCELSLLRALPFLKFVPSQLSAAALALAYHTLGSSIWNKKMQDTFGYEIAELTELILHLNGIHQEAESMQQQAIQDKYKASKYNQVSTIPPMKLVAEELSDMISMLDESDELNTTAENIESVRQKTEMLFN